jgi:hypothetical protein
MVSASSSIIQDIDDMRKSRPAIVMFFYVTLKRNKRKEGPSRFGGCSAGWTSSAGVFHSVSGRLPMNCQTHWVRMHVARYRRGELGICPPSVPMLDGGFTSAPGQGACLSFSHLTSRSREVPRFRQALCCPRDQADYYRRYRFARCAIFALLYQGTLKSTRITNGPVRREVAVRPNCAAVVVP